MRTILLFVSLALGGFLSAQSNLDDALRFLPPEQRSVLLAKNELTVFSDNIDDLNLWKKSPFASSVRNLFNGRESTMAAEALFLVPVPDLGDKNQESDAIFRAMTSVSTMKNLQVYSNSLKKMETFIFDAYRVGSLNKADRLSDPAPTSEISFTMFQKEEQTGESFSQYSYAQKPGWYQVTQTNLTNLNYGIVPLVSPHDLLTAVYVVPFQGKILVYGVTVAKTFDFFGVERSKTDSLYTRMKALVTWFSNNLNPRVP